MSGAQYLRQLLAPLGVYDLEGPFQNGELEALGEALDQAEAALDELHRESCLATAQDWGLERTASLFRRRPIAATPKAMREALAALENEGLVRTERTAGRYVTEDRALIEQLRAEAARNLTAEFLEKMRGIGYGPEQAATLLERWNEKEETNHD